jgi:hypothetical protein
MSKQIALSLAAFALATSTLSGCGAAVTGMTTATATTASAKDFATVDKARHTAARTRIAYDDMRQRWLATNDQQTKDKLDEQMIAVLVQGLGAVRSILSGSPDKDSRYTDIADKALSQYQPLHQQWAATQDITQRRDIITKIQWLLVDAVDQYAYIRSH